MTDWVTEYAEFVVSGGKRACKSETAACKRHLDDLKRDDLRFDAAEADRHIRFAEMLSYHDDDLKEQRPLRLRGFQKFIIGSLFGWFNTDGTRRYSEAYIQVARKNGKSFLCADLICDFALVDGLKDGQIYCAGNQIKDAKIVFDEVTKFIDNDPDLRELFKMKLYENEIIAKPNKTRIRALSKDRKIDGFKPYLSIIDEYHNAPDSGIYRVLLDGTVGLQNSLVVAITTAGGNLTGPCYKQYKFARNVAAQAINADYLFVYIAEIDLPDAHLHPDEYDRELWNRNNWALANPLLLYDDNEQVTVDPKKWRKFENLAKTAKEKSGDDEKDFIIKQLNSWTVLCGEEYISPYDWEKCGTTKTLEDMRGKRCYVGIDLSSKNDLTSTAAVFPIQPGIEKPYIYSHSYLPKATLQRHIRVDKCPYDIWERDGFLTLTDCGGSNGYIVDTKYIIRDLKEMAATYNLQIVAICYDPMGISNVLSDLEEICPNLIEVGQYPKSLNDCTRSFRATVQGLGVEYDAKNDLLNTSVTTAVAVVNVNKYMVVDKKDRNDRIDAVDAVLDAWCGATAENELLIAEQKANNAADEWFDLMDSF